MSADTAGLRASELTKLLTHELGLRTRTSLFGGSSTDDTNIRVMSDRRTTTAFSYKRDSKFDPAMAAESLLQVPTSNDDVESLDITDFFGSSQYDKERAEWAEKEAKKSVEPGVMVARLTVEGAKSAALPIVHIEDADLQRLRLRDLNTSGENVNTRAAHRHAPKLFAQAAEDFIRNSSSSQSDIVFSVANESYPLQDVSAHSPWPEPEISGARRRPSVYSRRRSLSHEEVRTDNVPIHVDTLSVDEEEDLIPAEVFDLSTMELKPDHPYLDISCRNLSHFPNFTQRFCTLVELHIVNNWITVVPEGGFRSLVALQVLDLSQNLFSEVPKELRALPELRELYIRENRLEIIPLEFRDCKTLEICDFSRNRLRIIDADVFYGMSSLRTLDLSHNTLETLPSSLGTLGGTLTILNLAGNPFNIEYARDRRIRFTGPDGTKTSLDRAGRTKEEN
ncbi:hypothetical protein BC832DRAFT_429779 [Gaertneriomyces semiglobifer]|nr:hypothetical protein BC832DRAFT_429779 [Gaertneriomyces semiglobifer]